MRFLDTRLPGVVIVEPDLRSDERGAFARMFCGGEFLEHGLDARVAQVNVSVNPRAGTLRGMHYQEDPFGEAKLVRATAGSIFDVAVDLRADSPTYLQWFAAELTAENRRGLFIPTGCAHGFQSLHDDSEVLYLMSTPYVPGSAGGVRWNDPALGIEWPEPPAAGRTISERDATYPDVTR